MNSESDQDWCRQRYLGLLVIAKTEVAMSHLAKQFEAKTSERECGACVG
jgi:23S rRNA-/tRNA-specific pseudouridylate synthase